MHMSRIIKKVINKKLIPAKFLIKTPKKEKKQMHCASTVV